MTVRLIGFLFIISLLGCVPANSSEQTRFALASARGDIDLVKQLVENNDIDINATNGKIGPALVSASYGGHKEVVEFLIYKNADINIKDEKGTTPLMNATVGEKAETVKLLLKKGANPNVFVTNEKGETTDITALTFAKMKKNEEITNLIQKYMSQK